MNTYQQLITMGFKDDISFDAAMKWKNVNEAVSYILEQQTRSKQNSNKSSAKSAANTGKTYQERINKYLNLKKMIIFMILFILINLLLIIQNI